MRWRPQETTPARACARVADRMSARASNTTANILPHKLLFNRQGGSPSTLVRQNQQSQPRHYVS